MKTERKAIVTILLGEKHQRLFNQFSRFSWERYCEKNSYDLVLINEWLDDSPRAKNRHIGWQKMLILSQDWSSQYDRVVWIDSDIIINEATPFDISETVPLELVGGCEHYGCPSMGIYSSSLRIKYRHYISIGTEIQESYDPDSFHLQRIENAKLFGKVLCTGVFVCSPAFHKDAFERIYYEYDELDHGEMPYVSYGLQDAGLIYWLPAEWNVFVSTYTAAFYNDLFWSSNENSRMRKLYNLIKNLVMRRATERRKKVALKNIYNIGYFIHFAGCHKDMLYLTKD